MARRMMWSPFSEGSGVIGLAVATNSRLDLLSLVETEVNRDIEEFTVTRIVGTLFFNGGVNSELVLTAAIRLQHEDIGLASVSPVGDPASRWLYHQDHVAMARTDSTSVDRINFDLRGQWKARGLDNTLWFMVENRSGQVINIHRTGRVLLKRA